MYDVQYERRRRRILDAARKEIYTSSYSDVTIRQIAARARIGKSTIYEYFSSKEELMTAVAQEEIEQILKVTDHILDSKKPLSERCKDVLGYYREVDEKIVFLIGAVVPHEKQRMHLANLLEEVVEELKRRFAALLYARGSDEENDAARELVMYFMLSQPLVWLMRFGKTSHAFALSTQMIDRLFKNTERK